MHTGLNADHLLLCAECIYAGGPTTDIDNQCISPLVQSMRLFEVYMVSAAIPLWHWRLTGNKEKPMS